MSIIIDLVVIVLLLVMCNENLQKGFWMGVLVAISYPVGTYFNTLSMTKFIGGFNIMHIIPLTILFCWFFKNCKLSFKINLYFVSIIVLILLYVINIFNFFLDKPCYMGHSLIIFLCLCMRCKVIGGRV